MTSFSKILGLGVLAACVIAVFLGGIIIRDSRSVARIAFLNVGQGDAILVSLGSNQLLIDTGKNSRALLSELGKIMPPWDRTLEMVLLTHPDQDHVGAFPDVVARYDVKLLLSAELPETSAIGQSIRREIDRRKIQRIEPRAGLMLTFAPDMRLETLFPGKEFVADPKNTNASSIVELLRVGKDAFLFTGDLPREESVLPATDIRVLKVAHHGSKYSTSDAFLDRMTPEEAVISVGKNSYGHPAEDVLTRLSNHRVRTFRTDTTGTILYTCPIVPDASCTVAEPSF